jgi:regulatory protein
MSKYSPEMIRSKIVAWCNKAERCQWDVRNKLMAWELPSADRENLIASLISSGLLNEERYARAFANDKSRFYQWGSQKIKQHLKLKGISERNIRDAIAIIDPEEQHETLLKLIRRKSLTLGGNQPYERRAKLIRYLLSKGFLHDEIQQSLQSFTDIGPDE